MSKERNIEHLETIYHIDSNIFSDWSDSKQQSLASLEVVSLMQNIYRRERNLQTDKGTSSPEALQQIANKNFNLLSDIYDQSPEKFSTITTAEVGQLLSITREDNTLSAIAQLYDTHGEEGVKAISNGTIRNVLAYRLPELEAPLQAIIALYEQDARQFKALSNGRFYSGTEADSVYLHEFYDKVCLRPSHQEEEKTADASWVEKRTNFLNTHAKVQSNVTEARLDGPFSSCVKTSSIC